MQLLTFVLIMDLIVFSIKFENIVFFHEFLFLVGLYQLETIGPVPVNQSCCLATCMVTWNGYIVNPT